MFLSFFLFIIIVNSFLKCLTSTSVKAVQGFTIDTEGKNVVTTEITNQGDCKFIAFTEKGTLIKYALNSSIISAKDISNNQLTTTTPYSKSFMCQYLINKIVVTRDKEIFEITLNSNGEDSLTKKDTTPENIISLHCNYNSGNYIYTYLSDDNKKYNFVVHDSSNNPKTEYSNTLTNAISFSSCFIESSSLVLCINILNEQKQLMYFYHDLNSAFTSSSGTTIDISNNIYEIKGSLIKYFSNNEVLLCLSTKPELIRDIYLSCFMLKEDINSRALIIQNTGSSKFDSIEKIDGDINYCQIDRLKENQYVSICLSYYYRTMYLLSIFLFKETNTFSFYNDDYNNLEFSLLKISQISTIAFQDKILGIFYRDIDDDSMILVFYPECGKEFEKFPKEGDNTNNCNFKEGNVTDFFFDECSHQFLANFEDKYQKYEKNQFCQVKNIECDNNNYFLDTDDNITQYLCRKKDKPKEKFYFDEQTNTFKKCYRSCLKCNKPEIPNHNCIKCDTNSGFYPFNFGVYSNDSQCYHKDEPIEKYFFDGEGFRKCRNECLTCNEVPNDTELGENDDTNEAKDTKCIKCNTADGYYPQVNKPSNCIKNDTLHIKFYYFNRDYKRWEKCSDGCKYCKEYGTSIDDTRCNIEEDDYCDTDNHYYKVESDDSLHPNQNCFKEDVRYNHYYFDSKEKMFKKCNKACLQCDTWGNITRDSSNTSCNICDEKKGYYPNEDDRSRCYHYTSTVYKYYLDPNTKLFRKCYKACKYCKEQINVNENDTQCSDCDSGYAALYETKDNEYNKNCIPTTKPGYYFKGNAMHKCPDKCTLCEYTNLEYGGDENVYCTQCNNDLRFYQIKGKFFDTNINEKKNKYFECYTWRIEKINFIDYNPPQTNTLLVGNYFEICHKACAQCTAISPSSNEFETHCQARKCSSEYIYVQNNEDICYTIAKNFPLHFKYYDPVLLEYYYKPCYETCETCAGDGTKRNNNCTKCRDGFIWHPNNITNAGNCIFDCLQLVPNNYYYLDESNNDEYICVEKCPDEYPFLQPVKKRCLKSCETEETLKYSKDRICVAQCPEKTTDNIKKECVSLTNECVKSDLETNLILVDINDTNINKIIVDYCHDYSYTSNQINNITNILNEFNITIYKNKKCVQEFYGTNINFPDLSVCYDDLKNYYNISQTQDLIVMIMNIYNNNSYIKVEYKVFDSITCEELDLSNCTKKNIFTEINMETYFDDYNIRKSENMYLNKDINVYDRDHPFFTDICYQYTTEQGDDMILEDRVNEYYQDISNICEKKCKPKADFDKRIIKCGCELKEKFLLEEDEENKKNWKFGIGGISTDVLKCAGKAFLWNNFKENIGSYTSLVLIVAEIPVIVYFIVNGLSQVKIFLIPFMGANPPPKNSHNSNSNKQSSNNNISKLSKIKESGNNGKNDDDQLNRIMPDKLNSIKTITTNNSKISNIRVSKDLTDKNSEDSLIRKEMTELRQIHVKRRYDIYKDIIDVEDLNDVELYDATILDRRTFCQFYYQELKNTQPIIYSFFYYTPLTPKFFKILHFIFNTTLCFVLNAFFYSKFYISEKCFMFESSFYWYFRNIYDRLIYTCLCTVIISLILRVSTSYKKKMIMWIKREKDPEVFNKEITNMMQRMKINYIIYCSVQGGFMFLFWLYLSSFCIAYKNNKMEWFVTSWICFGIIQIWYFISVFIITCLRFLGIKCGMESCYNVSICLAFD